MAYHEFKIRSFHDIRKLGNERTYRFRTSGLDNWAIIQLLMSFFLPSYVTTQSFHITVCVCQTALKRWRGRQKGRRGGIPGHKRGICCFCCGCCSISTRRRSGRPRSSPFFPSAGRRARLMKETYFRPSVRPSVRAAIT